MSIQKKRNIGLDLVKGFAALLVCMLHFLRVDFGEFIPGETYYPNWEKVVYGLCACSVPLFFFVNGYLVGCRHNETKSILMKIVNLLKLRIVVGGLIAVFICLTICESHTIANYMSYTFYLWFFEALIMVYAWVLVWDRVKNYKWSIIFPIVLFVAPFLTNFIGLLAASCGHTLPSFFGHTGLFRVYGIFYFMLPFYMNRRVIPLGWSFASVIAGLSLVALEVFVWTNAPGSIEVYDGMNACFPTIGALLMTIGFFSLFMTVKFNEDNIIVKYFAWLGRNCMGIYLFHMPFVILINTYLIRSDIPAICAIAICFAIISCSALIYSWFMKVKYLNYLLKI